MKPFRLSLTARALSAAAALALIGGGLIPILGLSAGIAVPILLLVTAGVGIVALILGVKDYGEAVALLAILSPLALFVYTLGLLLVVDRFASYAWVLMTIGSVPTCLFIVSLGSSVEEERIEAGGGPRLEQNRAT